MTREAANSTFKTSDGTELFYRHWKAEKESKKAIILFHRGHEHSGRLQHIVDELDLPDMNFFAWDARGHGNSPGKRGFSPSIGRSIKDVDEFVRYICENYNINIQNVIVIAQSVGAVYASAWVHDYAPKIRGLVLASPAFDVRLYVPFAKQGLKFAQKIVGNFFVNSYVKAKFLTHDPERIKSYETDELIAAAISANILSGLYDTAERVITDAQAITVPVQMFISGSDFVVNQKPQHEFFAKLSSARKEKYVMPGFFHDTLGEKDRAAVFEKMKRFINDLYYLPVVQPDFINHDKWGANAEVLRELQAPLKKWSSKWWYYETAKAVIKAGSRFSAGLKLGLETGFDSGSTLDFVYRNKTESKCHIGKTLDRIYLDSIGWKGIRARKENMGLAINEAIAHTKARGAKVKIFDIAAGHGRYILDAIGSGDDVESILLRDYSDLNVEKGQALIKERNLENKAQFVKGDAFDKDSLANIEPKQTIGIVSGLYELFPLNQGIRESLAGMSKAIEKDGLLIYTCQPYHPQLEMISRVLTSHMGAQAWTMRCRTQGEMDALVEEAGFEKINEFIDEWGIFTVSIAKKK